MEKVKSALSSKVFGLGWPPKSGVKKMRGGGVTVSAAALAKAVKKNK